jgi:hypothetical protein
MLRQETKLTPRESPFDYIARHAAFDLLPLVDQIGSVDHGCGREGSGIVRIARRA